VDPGTVRAQSPPGARPAEGTHDSRAHAVAVLAIRRGLSSSQHHPVPHRFLALPLRAAALSPGGVGRVRRGAAASALHAGAAHGLNGRSLASALFIAVTRAVLLVVEALDDALFASKLRFPCAPLARVKREIAAAAAVVLVSVPNVVFPQPLARMWTTVPVVASVFEGLKVLDIAALQNCDRFLDVVLPGLLFIGSFAFHAAHGAARSPA